ncbi:MAG: hypothetical protein KJP21_07020 [Bacteroidia bacterium]|nr:hypothetical protein [Bacteroidia bacterium]
MLLNIPTYLTATFFICILYTFYMFGASCKWNKKVMFFLIVWLGIQGSFGLFSFYLNTETMPPRILLLVLPGLLLIAFLFISSKGKQFIDSLDIKHLTLLHIVRIPVEFCLLWLFFAEAIPQLMTFEGRNFDILAGLTAPIVYYLYFIRKTLSKGGFMIWNIVSILLLLNIVINALLSTPLPIQQFAFDQPNVGILYFPFVWLPSFIVPIVFFSHFVIIRRLKQSD